MIRHDWWWDHVPAAAVVVGGVLGAAHIETDPGGRAADAGAYVVVAIAGLTLLARRRWPGVVLAVVTAALAAYTLRRYPGGPVYLAGAIALYSFALTVSRRVAWIAAASVAAIQVTVRVIADGDGLSVLDLLFAVWAALAVLAAEAVGARQERQRLLEAEAERRRAEDRLQLARDLHDSVAHSMAAINVQSGVAAHVLARRPDQAAVALEAIRVASCDVLDELAAMLDVLRDGTSAPRRPTPDLTQLDLLVASSRRAGVDVVIQVDGDLHAAGRSAGGAAYRILQEALTNVARHAETASASVHVDGRHGLTVEVLDDGVGAARGSGGTGGGLVGMRERAELTGGRLEAGPCPGGGFRVRASWPARP